MTLFGLISASTMGAHAGARWLDVVVHNVGQLLALGWSYSTIVTQKSYTSLPLYFGRLFFVTSSRRRLDNSLRRLNPITDRVSSSFVLIPFSVVYIVYCVFCFWLTLRFLMCMLLWSTSWRTLQHTFSFCMFCYVACYVVVFGVSTYVVTAAVHLFLGKLFSLVCLSGWVLFSMTPAFLLHCVVFYSMHGTPGIRISQTDSTW